MTKSTLTPQKPNMHGPKAAEPLHAHHLQKYKQKTSTQRMLVTMKKVTGLSLPNRSCTNLAPYRQCQAKTICQLKKRCKGQDDDTFSCSSKLSPPSELCTMRIKARAPSWHHSSVNVSSVMVGSRPLSHSGQRHSDKCYAFVSA